MKAAEIQKRIDAIQVALAAKGKRAANARFDISAHSEPNITLAWQKPGSDQYCDRDYKFFRDGDCKTILADADAFIAALPTAEETKMRDFMASLGSVIELGRKNGIEVDFLNPLTETMKRLSKNALTDQRATA